MCPARPQKLQMEFTTLIKLPLDSRLIFVMRLLPNSCHSCCATYEKIFEIVGMGSICKKCDQTLLYCSFKPLRNCIARSSSLCCAMVTRTEQEHLTVQEQIGFGMKFSISSHIMRNFVKYSVTDRSPCFIDDASC